MRAVFLLCAVCVALAWMATSVDARSRHEQSGALEQAESLVASQLQLHGVFAQGQARPVNAAACPFTLNTPNLKNPKVDAAHPYTVVAQGGTVQRTTDFLTQAMKWATGQPTRQCLTYLANAAVDCEVHLGACISLVQKLGAVCGVNGASIASAEKTAKDATKGGLVNGPKAEGVLLRQAPKHLWNWPQCGNRVHMMCPAWNGQTCTVPLKDPKTQCYMPKVAEMYTAMRSAVPGWPDNWMDELQPGDRMMIFLRGADSAGGHTIMFLGWADGGSGKDGKAIIAQGSYGHPVEITTLCARHACSPYYALVQTNKAA